MTTYLPILQSLLPSGAAWTRDPDAVLTRFLSAVGDGLGQADHRAENLITEADPRTTLEMLVDWERALGLPDPCTGVPETVAGRQRQVYSRWTARGGQSAAYFISLAQALGYVISIGEHRQALCTDPCTVALDPAPWHHVFEVKAPPVTIHELDCVAGGCDEPLRIWGNIALECALSRYAPAHSLVHFLYGDP
jgi:uncharacterized protein YmfQ (DUF2313 family)